jgi:deoxycytidylate deaminase
MLEILSLPCDHEGFRAAKQLADQSMCKKMKVGAAVWHPELGLLGAGNNDVDEPQLKCPREAEGFETGEGYWCCEQICLQKHHAEVGAIRHALSCVPAGTLVGATLYVWGHVYACDACREYAREAGIARIAFPIT